MDKYDAFFDEMREHFGGSIGKAFEDVIWEGIADAKAVIFAVPSTGLADVRKKIVEYLQENGLETVGRRKRIVKILNSIPILLATPTGKFPYKDYSPEKVLYSEVFIGEKNG